MKKIIKILIICLTLPILSYGFYNDNDETYGDNCLLQSILAEPSQQHAPQKFTKKYEDIFNIYKNLSTSVAQYLSNFTIRNVDIALFTNAQNAITFLLQDAHETFNAREAYINTTKHESFQEYTSKKFAVNTERLATVKKALQSIVEFYNAIAASKIIWAAKPCNVNCILYEKLELLTTDAGFHYGVREQSIINIKAFQAATKKTSHYCSHKCSAANYWKDAFERLIYKLDAFLEVAPKTDQSTQTSSQCDSNNSVK